MLIGTIGDIHGRTSWKEMIKNDKVEKWIFLGDYCDSFDISDEKIKENLIDIINFKKAFPDKVVLLLGNHDVMYYNPPADIFNYRCSGYRPQMHFDLYDTFSLMHIHIKTIFGLMQVYRMTGSLISLKETLKKTLHIN